MESTESPETTPTEQPGEGGGGEVGGPGEGGGDFGGGESGGGEETPAQQ